MFSGSSYPGALWSNEYHPSNPTGYTAVASAVAAACPDPGSGNVVILGDSWTGTGIGFIQAAFDLHFGHACNLVESGVTGETLAEQLDRYTADVAAHSPVYVVHFSGFANDCAQDRTNQAILRDVTTLVQNGWALGVRTILLGVAPFSLKASQSAALNPMLKTLLGIA